MDGVICHTNPYHAEAFKQFFEKRGVVCNEEDFVEHMYGKHNSYIMEHFFGRKLQTGELKELEDEKEGLFRRIYETEAKEIAGFTDFLGQLKQRGIKTGVATSAPEANLKLIMRILGFEKDMESILASEQVQLHKPHPEVYLKTAANLGVDPADCVVFEDSFSGVSAAKAAGMRVVGVLSSHSVEELPVCDYYIEDYVGLNPKQILDILVLER